MIYKKKKTYLDILSVEILLQCDHVEGLTNYVPLWTTVLCPVLAVVTQCVASFFLVLALTKSGFIGSKSDSVRDNMAERTPAIGGRDFISCIFSNVEKLKPDLYFSGKVLYDVSLDKKK